MKVNIFIGFIYLSTPVNIRLISSKNVILIFYDVHIFVFFSVSMYEKKNTREIKKYVLFRANYCQFKLRIVDF